MARVKRLSADYIPDLTAIEEKCFGSEKWNEAMLKAEFDNPLSEVYGITKHGRVIAYLSVQLIFDEAHIGNVAVLPEFRRKGHAARLLNYLFKRCEKAGVRDFTLEVSVTNFPAINLYKTHGFECAGERKRYYRNGADALIMWKKL